MTPHDFLRDQFFSMTLQATVQRASIYDPDSVEPGRTNFRARLRECLEEVIGRYGMPQSDTAHVEAIQALADKISEKCGSALRGARFRIGPAQKALNLSLKYHWAAGWIPEPPHCPLDAVIIALLPAKLRCNWTDLDDIDVYRRLIDAARAQAGDLSLSQWELREYQIALSRSQRADSGKIVLP